MSGATVGLTIEEAVARASFGVPSARKSGRNQRWPYVPTVVTEDPETGTQSVSQIPKRAFATRKEAVTYAALHVKRCRERLAADLANPRMRALRRQFGVAESEVDPEVDW